jgi:hypothetical protein
MAENVFDIGGGPCRKFLPPESQIVAVFEGTSRDQILRHAKRHRKAVSLSRIANKSLERLPARRRSAAERSAVSRSFGPCWNCAAAKR